MNKPTTCVNQWFNDHKLWIQELRETQTRSTAKKILTIQRAQMVGVIDLQTDPHDLLADALITKLFISKKSPYQLKKRIFRLADDLLACGVGGIVIGPLGIASLRPENFVPYPNFYEPELTIRSFRLTEKQCKALFGRLKIFDKALAANAKDDAFSEEDLKELGIEATIRLEEVYNYQDETFTYYCLDEPLAEPFEAKPWEGHYFQIGEERPQTPNTPKNKRGMPIGTLETLMGVDNLDPNMIEEYENIIEAITAWAKRASLCFIRENSITNPEMQQFLENNYHTIWVRGEDPIVRADMPSVPDMMAAYNIIQQDTTGRVGHTAYHEGNIQPGVQKATEVAVLANLSSTRLVSQGHDLNETVSEIIEAFADYLIHLPPEDVPPLRIKVSGQTEEYGPERPYAETLANVRVLVGAIGIQDYLQQRQDLTNALAIAKTLGPVVDYTRLAMRLFRNFGVPPEDIMLNQPNAGAGMPLAMTPEMSAAMAKIAQMAQMAQASPTHTAPNGNANAENPQNFLQNLQNLLTKPEGM